MHFINPYTRNGINGSFSGDTLRGCKFVGSLRITSRPLSARGPQSPRDPSVCAGGSCEVTFNVSSAPPSDRILCSGHSERVRNSGSLQSTACFPYRSQILQITKSKEPTKHTKDLKKHIIVSCCQYVSAQLGLCKGVKKVIQVKNQTCYDVYGKVTVHFRNMMCLDDLLWQREWLSQYRDQATGWGPSIPLLRGYRGCYPV